MSARLQPNFKRTPDLQDILGSYDSAEQALDAGNHYVALLKARAEKNTEIERATLIMCGAVQRCLNKSNPGKTPQVAFGYWCLGYKETAAKIFEDHQGFEKILSLLEMSIINVFILYGPHTRHGVPSQKLDGFEVRSTLVDRYQSLSSLSDVIPKGFEPEIIIVLDIYGHRLPDDLYDFEGPIIFLNYDFDVQLPHQYQDLQRADLIVANGAYEHYFLNKIYDCPVSVFPAYPAVTTLPSYPTAFNFSKLPSSKEIDFLHTGLSFTPTMREKAQFLFRLATIDNPNLNIRIHHGYMEDEEYRENILRAKFMPIFSAKMNGGIQTRTIDAICNGSFVFHGGEDVAIELFEASSLVIRKSSPNTMERDIAHNLSTFPNDWQFYIDNHQSVADELTELFLDPNERGARFLKFCLFEWARTGYRRQDMYTKRTTSVVGLQQCLASARGNNENAHGFFSVALYRAIEAVLTFPMDQGRREIVKSIFLEASAHYPRSVALLFNYGRFLWMIGENYEACEKFANLLNGLDLHIFEPKRDLVWLNFFQTSSEMMPSQDYFLALTKDLAKGDGEAKNARSVIGSTALSYLALNQLQQNNISDGLAFLDRALVLYPDHFPAARLRFKALHALGEDWEEVSKAFDLAINLYPPCLTDLLSYGVSAELAQNNEAEALSLIKTWAYFITRCTWEWETSHNIPEVNWKTIRTFFYQLPETLQTTIKERFPKVMG